MEPPPRHAASAVELKCITTIVEEQSNHSNKSKRFQGHQEYNCMRTSSPRTVHKAAVQWTGTTYKTRSLLLQHKAQTTTSPPPPPPPQQSNVAASWWWTPLQEVTREMPLRILDAQFERERPLQPRPNNQGLYGQTPGTLSAEITNSQQKTQREFKVQRIRAICRCLRDNLWRMKHQRPTS